MQHDFGKPGPSSGFDLPQSRIIYSHLHGPPSEPSPRSQNGSTLLSSSHQRNRSRRSSRRYSAGSSVRSADSTRLLSSIPTLSMNPTPPTMHMSREYLPASPPQLVRDLAEGSIDSNVSTIMNSDFSSTGATETCATDPSDAAFPDVRKTPVDEYNIDEATNTVAKLPDEFLRNARELIIQNPTPGSGGWFSSSDKNFQYVLVFQHGKPFMWDRQTNEKKALDEVFTFATGFRKPMISGLRGRPERLDPDYIMRNSSFFTIGKVFSILFTEPCSEPARNRNSPNVSTVLYGEKVYSQITRFVVVQVGRGFCYACPILTYGGRATLKPGCNSAEHAIAYTRGYEPNLLPGEHGINKSPIEIVPSSDETQILDPASRIRFGRGQVIQHNVKAKEIGQVADDHISRLLSYWREEICGDFGYVWVNENEAPDNILDHTAVVRAENIKKEIMAAVDSLPSTNGSRPSNSTGPRRDTIHIDGIEYVFISEVGGQLHSGFDLVRNTRSFFKKGRCFMVFWPELAGTPESERTIYWKIRRFVVIRARATYCLCLSINTYQGQGATKSSVTTQDHAPIVPVDGEVHLHPDEQNLTKSPIRIKTEDASISIDPMARINFGKVYTVEYNLKVRKIGRIISESIRQMEDYFIEAAKLSS